ncbi:hypothetical protein [Alienimonas sp. DA493]|uniref:hypothetical protein n=1 Tax=Alienimonas sp. DA493 TaxID=3373605 RepID=UPI003754EEA1
MEKIALWSRGTTHLEPHVDDVLFFAVCRWGLRLLGFWLFPFGLAANLVYPRSGAVSVSSEMKLRLPTCVECKDEIRIIDHNVVSQRAAVAVCGEFAERHGRN